MSTSGIVLLVLAALCWLLLIAVLSEVLSPGAHSDPIGSAIGWILAYVLVCGIWVCLGGLILRAGVQGLLPPPIRAVALLGGVASAAACLGALWVVSTSPLRWPLALVGIPPLLAAYVVALYQPALRGALGSSRGHFAVWGMVAAVTVAGGVAALRLTIQRNGGRAAAAAQQRVWEAQEAERRRAGNLEKLRSMPSDAHLTDWYGLLDPDSGVRQEALEALRKVPRRQGDMEQGIAHAIPYQMQLLPELALEPTPELCAAAGAFLEKWSERLRPRGDPRPYPKDMHVEEWLPGVRWLLSHGCDCRDGLARVEASVRTWGDSPARASLLAELARMRSAGPAK